MAHHCCAALLASVGLVSTEASALSAIPRPAPVLSDSGGDFVTSAKYIGGILLGGIIPSPALYILFERALSRRNQDACQEALAIESLPAPDTAKQNRVTSRLLGTSFLVAGIVLRAFAAARQRRKCAQSKRSWRVTSAARDTRDVGTLCPERELADVDSINKSALELKPPTKGALEVGSELVPLTKAALEAGFDSISKHISELPGLPKFVRLTKTALEALDASNPADSESDTTISVSEAFFSACSHHSLHDCSHRSLHSKCKNTEFHRIMTPDHSEVTEWEGSFQDFWSSTPQAGMTAKAVCFLRSYTPPEYERAAG